MAAIREQRDVMSPPEATSPIARHMMVEEGEVVPHHLATVRQASGEGTAYQAVVHYLRR